MGYSVDVTAPDIEPYRHGNTEVEFVHRFDSGKPGPRVTITGIIHGNELCGAIALDHLLRREIRPRAGVLTLCFANPDAYQSFDPQNPYNARYIEQDFNRLWSPEVLDGGQASVELSRARAMRGIIDETDLLLDLHSMADDGPPLALAGTCRKGAALAQRIGTARHIICDAGHASGVRLRDYGDFANKHSPKTAVLMECGQHWRQTTADHAIASSLRFLEAVGLIAAEDAHTGPSFEPPETMTLYQVTDTVTVRNNGFFFTRPVAPMECIPAAGTELGRDGAQRVLTPYDDCYLVMPQTGAQKGMTAVRLAKRVQSTTP